LRVQKGKGKRGREFLLGDARKEGRSGDNTLPIFRKERGRKKGEVRPCSIMDPQK